ncbi:DUF2922 domain-containing protein [Pectinatus haikarae]|uniref:DUF2922 domain-containing protein n=1 Tax=Pectinatus haikarae TaxID=349096 RepID=A0ABT9Y425_9FIRM|nr:DUF2922 domain-containing protein [Pectinatus haikarae]MDQ0202581.1 hypothetical protein [Pectinatus haikarae]
MAVTKNLQMVFALADGKKLTYNLTDPKDDVTKAQVETVMNGMITNSVVMKDNVAAAKIDGIYVRTVESTEL